MKSENRVGSEGVRGRGRRGVYEVGGQKRENRERLEDEQGGERNLENWFDQIGTRNESRSWTKGR